MLAASTARAGGTPSGTGTTASAGSMNMALMRMQREHQSGRARRPLLDPPDRRIAVFDRERKRAAHERRAHALEFARRHPAGEDEPLGAAADRAEERAHAHLARRPARPTSPRAVRRGRAPTYQSALACHRIRSFATSVTGLDSNPALRYILMRREKTRKALMLEHSLRDDVAIAAPPAR